MTKKNLNLKTISQIVGLDLSYFLTGGFWITFSFVLSGLGGIILSSLFARFWPPDVYGQYSFLITALSLVGIFALPGMTQAVTQAAAENKDGTYKQISILVTKWSIIGLIILVLGSIYFYFRLNQTLAIAVLISALAFPITSGASLFNSFLIGKKQFKIAAIFNTVAQLVSILATGIALWKFPSLIIVALFSAWSTAIINILLTFLTMRKVKNSQVDQKITKVGIHLSFTQIFTISSEYLDKLLIPVILGFTNNAIYSFAILIPLQLHALFKIFLILGQPKIAQLKNSNLHQDIIKKSLLLEILISFIILVYIISAPTIFHLLYPSYQDQAVRLSQLFSLSLLYFPTNLLGLAFIKKRQVKPIYQTNAIFMVATALSLVVLLPTFGLLGAIISKIFSRIIYSFVQIYYFKKFFKSALN